MRARLYVPCRHARSAPQHPCIGCHPCRSSVRRAVREQGSGNRFRTPTHKFPGWVIRWGVFASLECGCHVLVRHNAPRRHPGLSRVDIQILKKEFINKYQRLTNISVASMHSKTRCAPPRCERQPRPGRCGVASTDPLDLSGDSPSLQDHAGRRSITQTSVPHGPF